MAVSAPFFTVSPATRSTAYWSFGIYPGIGNESTVTSIGRSVVMLEKYFWRVEEFFPLSNRIVSFINLTSRTSVSEVPGGVIAKALSNERMNIIPPLSIVSSSIYPIALSSTVSCSRLPATYSSASSSLVPMTVNSNIESKSI